MHFQRLDDPVVEQLGHRVDSVYVETFWLPILGPSSVLMLRLVDRMLTQATTDRGGISLERPHLSRMLGLGEGVSRHAPVSRTLARLVAFSAATVGSGELYSVRSHLAPLTARQVARLPQPLQAAHGLIGKRTVAA